jgi:hypothetical protein
MFSCHGLNRVKGRNALCDAEYKRISIPKSIGSRRLLSMAWERQGSAGNSIDYLMSVAYNIETIEKMVRS